MCIRDRYSAEPIVFSPGNVERLRINSNGQISIRGTNTAFDTTGDLNSLQLYYEQDSGQASIGPYSSGGSTHLSFYTNLSSAAATEKLRINSYGQIITGGGTGISFNNVGNSAFGSFFEVNGSHTINNHGVLGISGATNGTNNRIALIQFLNTENSNSSSTGNANSRSLGHISVYADTSDSNAGDDCGGRIVIGTKGEAAGMNDLLFLTSDKTVGIQAIPAVGDMNSTATGGAALSDPKLYVYDGGTNGKYNLMIRCNSGSDADNTGSAIALNHSNDRGILIEGGRWSGNRAWGAIKAIDNIGRVTDGIAIRGGNGAGIQDIRIYTGEAVTTTERIRINTTGVGMRIDPQYPLHVYNPTINTIGTFESGDAGAGILLKDNTHFTRLESTGGDFKIDIDAGSDVASGEDLFLQRSGTTFFQCKDEGYQGIIPRQGTMMGTYVYRQRNQGASYKHYIRGPMSGYISSEMDDNYVAYVRVQCMGTGTDSAWCYYRISRDSQTSATQVILDHLSGGSSGNSNVPYMELYNGEAAWLMSHSANYYVIVRVEITGGKNNCTYITSGEYGSN